MFKRRWTVRGGLLPISVLMAALALFIYSQYVQYIEVEINSGRVRSRSTLFAWTFHEEVQDTDFSRFVEQHVSSGSEVAEWHTVHRQQPMSSVRINYRWGGSTNQLRWAGMILAKGDLRTEDKIDLARCILEELKKGGNFYVGFGSESNEVSLQGERGVKVWTHDVPNLSDLLAEESMRREHR